MSTECCFGGCDKPGYKRGLCSAHYSQLMRGQNLRPTRATIADLDERIDSRTTRSAGCWSWQGAHSNVGYAQVRKNKKLLYVHRVMYERHNGPIPTGLVIDHTCHNRGCINPAHLQAVTNKQNIENRRGATKRSKTGVRGVYFHKRSGKFIGEAAQLGRKYYAGAFDTVDEASAATSRMRSRIFTNSLIDDPATQDEDPVIIRAID